MMMLFQECGSKGAAHVIISLAMSECKAIAEIQSHCIVVIVTKFTLVQVIKMNRSFFESLLHWHDQYPKDV